MVSLRRRSPTSSPVEHLEKGSLNNQPSRLCLLVSLSAFFWLLLICLSFFIHGDRSVLDFTQFIPVSVNSESISTRKVSDQLSDTEPLDALKRPFIEPENTQNLTVVESEKSPVVLPKKSGKPPDSELDKTPVVEPKRVKSPPDIESKKPPVVPKKVKNLTVIESEKSPVVEPKKADKASDIKPEKPPVVEPKEAEIVLMKSPDFDPNKTEPLLVDQSTNNTRKNPKDFPFMKALKTIENKGDPCGGRYVYMHNLPPRFNEDMVKECKSLNPWANMCKFTNNAGLGPPLENIEGVFSNTGWYATDQFALDVIFTNRMKQYECLTSDSSLAAAIFVPFYAGFDIARHLWGFNTSVRDAASLDLVDWLEKRPEWQIMGGKDHFLVSGRISWDFRRLSDENSDWGSKLLRLPAAKNMSMLVVESSPWNANDFGIPYPTYFHPAKDADVFDWQERMRNLDRKWLFSFAGAPRPDDPKSIRGQIIHGCRSSKVCKLLECDLGESKCHSPSSIMKMFQSSLFCLQPQGDSYTRRSSFDSILAGCIPVFFHPGSAYTQYTWHLPKAYSNYSVLIPENDVRKSKVSIEQTLSQIPPEQVKIMREKVISLIPRLIYADPRSKLETLKDAFDVSVQAVIDKVTKLRRDIVDGRTNDDFIEELSWKYSLLDEGQSVGPHDWDRFFSKSKNGND